LNFFKFGTILAILFVLAGNLNKPKGCVSRVQPEPGCRYGLLAQWPLLSGQDPGLRKSLLNMEI